MCRHYQALKERKLYRRHFGVKPPADLGKHDLWQGYVGSFIRRHPHADVGDEAVPTRIARADGEPMGITGLWSSWKSPKGELVYSYTLLTINTDDHSLMRLFHKPADEKHGGGTAARVLPGLAGSDCRAKYGVHASVPCGFVAGHLSGKARIATLCEIGGITCYISLGL